MITARARPRERSYHRCLRMCSCTTCFDLWINQWRKRHAKGECVVVRYADDFVIGFEHEADARACLEALGERLEKFGLNLHPKKTRLIEFGRGSAAQREREGRGKCETFDFLGFTHVCGKTRRAKRFALQADHDGHTDASHAGGDQGTT